MSITVGLTTTQAQQKLLQVGPNVLVPKKKSTLGKKIISVLLEPMFVLLFITTLIYFFLGEPRDGLIMLGFIVVIVAIDIIQEWRTDKTLEALRELASPQVTVFRDDKEQIIDPQLLVPGDVMLVTEGEKIAADGVIINREELLVDQSSLTGESNPVLKVRDELVLAGTIVVHGGARVRVEKTGSKTEYGKIGQEIASAKEKASPLQCQINKLVKYAAIAAGGLFLLVTIVTWFDGSAELGFVARFTDSLIAGVTIAMAMIPEEFPVVLTVFLSLGAWRLARKKALTRHLPTVETLGAVKVIFTDKTGTLTENKMTVVDNVAATTDQQLRRISFLACEEDTFDPMEKAIVHFAKVGLNLTAEQKKMKQQGVVKDYIFNNVDKMMGHLWLNDDEYLLTMKGAPEKVLPLCQLTAGARKRLEQQQEALAAQSYRIIAVASKKWRRLDKPVPEKLIDYQQLEFVGLLALADPPRTEAAQAIAHAREAGVRVIMITGDNGTTAKAVAKQVGLDTTAGVITGEQLAQLTDSQLRAQLEKVNVFARVVPSDKLRLVKQLRALGIITAMIGDGVNDAPALKNADIGIAMGKRGTQVAQEAADMIITDDNFATIVRAIRDGRRIYDNLRKSVIYIFVIHIPIALAALLAPILGIAPENVMLLPLQVLILELIIDPTCSIVFERQPAESNVMKRGPRGAKSSLIEAKQVAQIVAQGLSIFIASFGIYLWQLSIGQSAALARTMGVLTLSLSSLFLVYVNSSFIRPAWRSLLIDSKDKVIWLINGGIVAMLLLVIYSPLNQITYLAALNFSQFAFCLLLALVATIWWELLKPIINRLS